MPSFLIALILIICSAPLHAGEHDALIASLAKKVTDKPDTANRYTQTLHNLIADYLPHADAKDRDDAELITNLKAFAAGELSEQVFTIYFREAHQRPLKRRLRMLQVRADRGDAAAMFQLAVIHQQGKAVEPDLPTGVKWLTASAQAGHLPAMIRLADLYRIGHGGLPRDHAKARSWYEKAAALKSPWAMLMLGELLSKATDTPDNESQRNKDQARKWFAAAREAAKTQAEAGDAQAMYVIGYMLIDDGDQGLNKDYPAALPWYRKAAELQHGDAMNSLGYLYAHGIGVEQDWNQAVKWWDKAAALEQIDAIQWLARIHRDGTGVTRDFAASMKWYLHAAERGSAFAMNEVGYLHDAGMGVPVDYAQAMHWYMKAASLNHPKATNNVGVLHQFGKGQQRNPHEAIKWYRKAADLGEPESMYHMALLYQQGEAVERDLETARTWMEKAANLGEARAKQWLESQRVQP